MSTNIHTKSTGNPSVLPLRNALPRLLRDPVNTLADIGVQANGEIVRINIGPFRPYLVTHPDHLQHILRVNSANYIRDGVFWKPLRRFFGSSIVSDGQTWKTSRKVLQPVFTVKNVDSLTDRMAETIAEEVDRWDRISDFRKPVDMAANITRIVTRTVIKVFFGDKIDMADAERLVSAVESIGPAVVFRFLLPFLPDSISVPGDRTFWRSIRTLDEVFIPLVRKYREKISDDQDIVSVLCRAKAMEGGELTDQWVRDNLIAMFASGIETTSAALIWVWPVLARHPEVANKLYEEIDSVVRGDRVQRSHLAELSYTKQVIQEMLRLHPVSWIFNRMVVTPETVGGVSFKHGDTILISPYATHRLEAFWDRPLEFDPDRFASDRSAGRHRYAYFPFGGGPHICIGMYVFNLEAELIIANILSRFRPVACSPMIATPRMGASLRPRQHIEVTLRPITRSQGGARDLLPR